MDLGPLRTLALSINLNVHGVAATVTRPAPDNTPITTRGIWLRSVEDEQPFGTDVRRREPRRVLALPRADVPSLNRGTLVVAADPSGGSAKTWRVDGLEQAADPDFWRAIVVQVQS